MIQETGAARARELIVLGDSIDGRKAAEWGLVHRAVPEEELDEAVESLVSQGLQDPVTRAQALMVLFALAPKATNLVAAVPVSIVGLADAGDTEGPSRSARR